MEIPQEDSPAVPERSFIQKVQEKLAASRFLTFSILLHVILLILAGGVIVVQQMANQEDFSAEGGGGLVNEEVAATPPAPEPDTPTQSAFTPTAPEVTAPSIDAITSKSTVATTFKMQQVMPTVKSPASVDMNKALKPVASAVGSGMSRLPGTMGGRAGGSARMALMQKNKMSDKAEMAVLKGLRWLKQHQNSDGSWSDTYKPSMTGLAVLCFLGHDETPEKEEFGPTVKLGIDWLLNNGIANQGRLSGGKDSFAGNHSVYEHGIGAYALGEYYSMTQDERVKDVLQQAIGYIVEGQAPDGGWQYGFAKGPDSDTSVSGWQIQALKAAHLTGLNISGVDEALDKAMGNLKRVQGPNGGFGYTKAEDRYSLAGVGVLCLYFWKGEKDAKPVREGIKFIIEKSEKEHPVEYKGKSANLYAWYYHTQACLMYGQSAWTKWNGWFQDELINAQSPDGSWPPTGAGKLPGPETDAGGSGPYYRTTLCTLMLEVFYRYMPSSK